MKRKIVQHGSSSLSITLPMKWVKKFDIKKGDELDLIEENSTLMININYKSQINKKEVNTTEFGVFTKNNLTHLYQLGYDEIEIRFDDEKSLQEIRARVPECIGYEIIDQKQNKIYIKSIASALETEFDVLLRKAFLITKEMGEAVFDTLSKEQFDKLKEIRHQEFLNNKFTMCCVRILNKRGYKESQRNMQVYDICKLLERIADEYKYICDLLDGYDKKISKDILSYFKRVLDYYEAFYKIYYKFDPVLKSKIYTQRRLLMKDAETLMMKAKDKEVILMHYLSDVAEKTYDASGEYFALML